MCACMIRPYSTSYGFLCKIQAIMPLAHLPAELKRVLPHVIKNSPLLILTYGRVWEYRLSCEERQVGTTVIGLLNGKQVSDFGVSGRSWAANRMARMGLQLSRMQTLRMAAFGHTVSIADFLLTPKSTVKCPLRMAKNSSIRTGLRTRFCEK